MRITHEIHKASLECDFEWNLKSIAERYWNTCYTVVPVHMLTWRHRKIGGTCILYGNLKAIIHGTRPQLRRYLRLLQKGGFITNVKLITTVTKSAVHRLSSTVNYQSLASRSDVYWTPDLFHAPNFKVGRINFTVFHSGQVVITGIKSTGDVNRSVWPTLLELELYTHP